jgi:CheY-like chemotaxis protein
MRDDACQVAGKAFLLEAVRAESGMSELKANSTKLAENRQHLIFVVDDEPMLLELATVILEPQGFIIKSFRDPELAVAAFTKASPKPDLVITDYAMHSMNGMQLVEQIHRLEPRQKILLVSGTVGEEVFRDSPARPDMFLAKPYQAHQLTEAVKSLINRK